MGTRRTELPPKEIAVRETARRESLLSELTDRIKPAVSAILLYGSMSVSADYSIYPDSDLDIGILIQPNQVTGLRKLFDNLEISQYSGYLDGYAQGLAALFSVPLKISDIPIELHFWDLQTCYKAIRLREKDRKRFTSTAQPKTTSDHNFFGETLTVQLPLETVSGFHITTFPSYLEHDRKIYFGRPITNFLQRARILYSKADLQTEIDNLWTKIAGLYLRQKALFPDRQPDFFSAFPQSWRISPESREVMLATFEKALHNCRKTTKR